MEKIIKDVAYLSATEIIDIQKKIILKTGGLESAAGRLLHPDSLYYLIDIVKSDLYYSSIYQKAAVYMYNIITRHIFFDGDKRTGIICAFVFLWNNGYNPKEEIDVEDIISIGVNIAKKKIGLDEVINWLKDRIA